MKQILTFWMFRNVWAIKKSYAHPGIGHSAFLMRIRDDPGRNVPRAPYSCPASQDASVLSDGARQSS